MATYNGTNDPNALEGSSGADTLNGYGGDDTLYGGGGGDFIDDTSSGNLIYGDRYLTAPADRDDGGNDTISAGAGNTVYGEAGNDLITSSGGATLDGGSGNDTLSGGAGVNLILGGLGADVISGTGQIWTDDGTTSQGGDVVRLSQAARTASGLYDIQDFQAGAGGDLLSFHQLLADLIPAGYTGINPLLDLVEYNATGTRVVQSSTDFIGGNSWLRLRQGNPAGNADDLANGIGAGDLVIETDANGIAGGSGYNAVAILRNVSLASFTEANVDPAFSFTGTVVDADIAGFGFAETITVLDGNDSVQGNGGNDTVYTNFGNDTVDGGDGYDTIWGGVGNDRLLAGDGTGGRLYGEAGDDVLMATSSSWLEGGLGQDILSAGSGADTLYGGDGDDTLTAGAGDDYLYGDAGEDSLDGGSGRDYLSGGGDADRLYAGVSNVVYGATAAQTTFSVDLTDAAGDNLNGGDGNDTLISGAGNDTVDGGAGAGIIFTNGGNDVISGGSGYVDAGTGNDTITGGNGFIDAGSGDDLVDITASSTLILGRDGNDTIRVRGSSNQIEADVGNNLIAVASGDRNVITAGDGNDRIEFEGSAGAGSATATTGAGVDVLAPSLRAREANFSAAIVTDFSTGVGGDRLDLTHVLGRLAQLGYDYSNPFTSGWMRLEQNGADTDLEVKTGGPASATWTSITRFQNTTASAFTVDNFDLYHLSPTGAAAAPNVAVSFTGTTANERNEGWDFDDTLSGDSGNDTLDGGFGGNDSLLGGLGNDWLLGFGGNDTLAGGADSDDIHGGSGDDLILGGSGDDFQQSDYDSLGYKGSGFAGGLHGGAGNDTIDGGDGNDGLSGEDGDDSLLGGAGNDGLSGNAGNDTLRGGDGTDSLSDNSGTNALYGDAGNDTLVGSGRLEGGADNDALQGAANASLVGGLGDDTLVADGSFASLEGNEGNDTFLAHVSRISLSGGDGDDLIWLSGSGNQVDSGAGNDRIDLEWQEDYWHGLGPQQATGTLTTGSGTDTIELSLRGREAGNAELVITDFTAGVGGDKLDLTNVLGRLAQLGYDYGNPFTSGWMRLNQNGADTDLEVRTGGPASSTWLLLAKLQNTSSEAIDLGANLFPQYGAGGVSIMGTAAGELISDSQGIASVFTGLGNDTVDGDAGNDTLDGGADGNDSLLGGLGNDWLLGFGGNDTLDGGADSDDIHGGSGDDLIRGGSGDDFQNWTADSLDYKGSGFAGGLHGGAGNDTIDGGDGNDGLSGEDGDDSLLGGAGNDGLSGNAGNDTLRGGDGADSLSDTSGTNALYGDAGNDTLVGSGRLEGGADNDALQGAANASLVGGLGDDSLVADGLFASLEGNEGNDTFIAHVSRISLNGGDGDDLIWLSGSGNQVDSGAGNDRIDLEWQEDYWHGLGVQYATGTLTTGSDADTIELTLRGREAGNAALVITDFTAGVGGDKLDLTNVLGRLAQLGYDYGNPFTSGWMRLNQNGADTDLEVRTGGPASSTWLLLVRMNGTLATDLQSANFVDAIAPLGFAVGATLLGNVAAERLVGFDGDDTVDGDAGNDTLDGGFGGNDSLLGGLGNDWLLGFGGNDTLAGGADSDDIHGGSGDDLILGGSGDDFAASDYDSLGYKGSGFAGGLHGGAGNDTIDGGDGKDGLSGGDGDDSLLGGAGNDGLSGNAGNDTLRGGDGADSLSDTSGTNALYGDAGNDTLVGSGRLEGGADNDALQGAANASLIGGLGDDSLVADGLFASLEGNEGNDTFLAHVSRISLSGGDGDDLIWLSGSGNQVDSGAGNDRIDLEWQEDYWHGLGPQQATGTLTTGGGTDTIELSLRGREAGNAALVITDFTTGVGGDKLDLASVQSRLTELGQAATTDPFTTGWLRLSASGNDTLLEFDSNGTTGGAAFQTLAVLQNTAPASFTADNFVQVIAPAASGNQAPQLQASKTVSVVEDTQTALAITAPTDADAGALTIKAIALPNNGKLKLAAGTAVTTNQVLSSDDLAGLTFTPSLNYNGTTSEFRYTVQDAGGSIVEGRIAFQVTPVNDAPTANAISTQTYIDGSAFSLSLAGRFGDVDAGDALAVSVTQADGSALPDWLGFDPASLLLAGTPPVGFTSSLSLKATATDLAGLAVSTSFAFNLRHQSPSGGTGSDTLSGASGNDSLSGNAGDDSLSGGAGNDSLTGGTGNDTLAGGSGDDVYVVDATADVIVENADEGYDTVNASATYTLSDNVEKLTLTGSTAINGSGNALANLLTGNGAANTLDGGAGNDTLDGGAGADWLQGGAGDDALTGGTGADHFLFDAGDAGIDTIADFTRDDVIDLAAQQASILQVATGADITELALDLDGIAGADLSVRLQGRWDESRFSVTADAGGHSLITYDGAAQNGAGSVQWAGTPTQGAVLTASHALTDPEGIPTSGPSAVRLQWLADGAAIDGATTASLQLTQAQVGRSISVQAIYVDLAGSLERRTSAATPPVENVNDTPAGNVTITGTAEQGQTLTAVQTLTDADGLGEISYTWLAGGQAIASSGTATLLLTQAEVGQAITVRASYQDAFGHAESVPSGATDVVANVNDAPQGGVSIAGNAVQGQTLTAGHTLADADGMGTLSYQWLANGLPIDGASGSSLTLSQAEVGKTIAVRADYTDGFGHAESATAAATAVVENVNDAPTGAITITGIAARGRVLSASSTLADLDGMGTMGYQWKADGADITGATLSSLILGDAEVGKAISVVASYTDGHGTQESVASAPTGAVGAELLANLDGIVYQWKHHALLGGQAVSASHGAGPAASQTTGADGHYHLDALTADTYSIVLERGTSDTGNAITSADALAALRLAVGVNPNTDGNKVSPYQFMAADANSDGKVTSADALAILRMAVKLATAPAPKWLFVSETTDLWDDVSQSSSLTRSSTLWNSGLTLDLQQDTTASVVAILRGDVNGSWSAPAGSLDLDVLQPAYFANLSTLLGVPDDVWGI